MNLNLLSLPIIVAAVILSTAALASENGTSTKPSDETAYLAENRAAMTKMMEGMEAKPTGDVDRDFVAMMVPHHEAAIEMARALLRYGHNEQLRRMAQEIIVDQLQEISIMRSALDEPLPASMASPTQAPELLTPLRTK